MPPKKIGASAKEELPSAITDRFGEVVWVKQRGYPHWPAYVYDPAELSPALRKQLKTTRDLKQFSRSFFAVFYYGWPAAGSWCKVKHENATAFSVGAAEYGDAKAMKIKANQLAQFKLAVAIGRAEDERDPDERVAWNHHRVEAGMKLRVAAAAEGDDAITASGVERQGTVKEVTADGITATVVLDSGSDGGGSAEEKQVVLDIRTARYELIEDNDDEEDGSSGSDGASGAEAGKASAEAAPSSVKAKAVAPKTTAAATKAKVAEGGASSSKPPAKAAAGKKGRGKQSSGSGGFCARACLAGVVFAPHSVRERDALSITTAAALCNMRARGCAPAPWWTPSTPWAPSRTCR